MSVSQVTPTQPTAPLFDMSKAQPIAAAQVKPSAPLFDMSKAKPIAGPSPSSARPQTPSTLTDTSPMADPGQGKPYEEPETKGPLHQIGGLLQGAGENVAGAIKGVHDLFQEPQNDDEKAIQQKVMIGDHGELGGRLALAGYRFLHGVNDTLNQSDKAGELGAKEAKESGSTKAGVLTDLENEPFVGNATKLAEQGEYGKALGDLLTSIALMRGGAKGAQELPAAAEGAEAAIPRPISVGGTELPETVGQAASRANSTGIGSDIKGVEDVAKRIPGSEGLRDVSNKQQAAAREILADKASTAVSGTPAQVSKAPESIEQNAANAAEAARQAGSAKYEELSKAASIGSGADFTKPVEAANSILSDDTLAKVLPKSARDALGKVAASLTDREEIAHQIYGKAFSDLDGAKQSEVGKAMLGPAQAPPFDAILKARSELSDAANGMKDAADRFQAHKAVDQFDQAINESLKAHDEVNGTDLSGTLAEGKRLWSQKYAFEEFRDGLQSLMRDHPTQGIGRSTEQHSRSSSMISIHAERKGRHSSTECFRMIRSPSKICTTSPTSWGRIKRAPGGMASSFAKLRILGLKESAIGLIANAAGFSWLLSRPGMARNFLTALSAGKNIAKTSAAIGAINNAANQVQNTQSGSDPDVPEGRVPVKTPGGVYHFPDAESARRFQQAAGIQ